MDCVSKFCLVSPELRMGISGRQASLRLGKTNMAAVAVEWPPPWPSSQRQELPSLGKGGHGENGGCEPSCQ